MTLHELLDTDYGADGGQGLRARLGEGADCEARRGPFSETALHVATRRRRLEAVEILLDHGAEIDARTAGGKTAYAHAVRRGFDEVADLLRRRGAQTELSPADQLAVAVVEGRLGEARELLRDRPELARTGNPEEDRLLADVAGRSPLEPVRLLLEAGADLGARALDDGTALHQAAWFGQPRNGRLLIDAGAPLDVFDGCHASSPLGWAVHGARCSGGAAERRHDYAELVRMLLEAGSSLRYPGESDRSSGADEPRYFDRLLRDAVPGIRELLEAHAPG